MHLILVSYLRSFVCLWLDLLFTQLRSRKNVENYPAKVPWFFLLHHEGVVMLVILTLP